jgi:NTE family protein
MNSKRQFLGASLRAAGLMSAAGFSAISGLTGCASAEKPVGRKPAVALVLGGGAARGFAHVGVIKVLEAQGIQTDLIVGTSAGSLVGALYASGMDAFELQRVALSLDESTFSDWTIGGRGVFKGEAIANYVNQQVKNRPIEQLPRPLAIVATDIRNGERIIFQRGDTGTAVRASSAVPGVFSPVKIGDREYVDGGLTHPVPVSIAKSLGADVIIAVDISARPGNQELSNTINILLQTFTIMGNQISRYELNGADILIRPATDGIRGTDFTSRNISILEGERATLAQLDQIRAKISAVPRLISGNEPAGLVKAR